MTALKGAAMDRNLMPYGASIAYRPEWGRRRKKSSMSYVTRVQSLLSKKHGNRLTSYEIAVLADITVLNFQRHAAEMVENDYISRVKRKGDVCYRYFLSDEQLEAYKQRTGRGVSDDDTWIEVTPETLPPSLQDVDVFIEGSPYYDGEHVERGFYDADTEQWCSNHDGAPFDSGLVVTWWRKGSLPPDSGVGKVTS
jgi:DNA-binding MarR family transcriptional regulator